MPQYVLKRISLVLSTLLLGACVVETKRLPLSEQARALISQPVAYTSIVKDDVGAELMLQDSSGFASQYGLVGAIVAGVMDDAMNSSPISRAQKSANDMHALVSSSQLTEEMNTCVREQLRTAPFITTNLMVKKLNLQPGGELPPFPEDSVLAITVEHALTPTLLNLKTTVTAQLINKSVAKKLPKNSIKDSDRKSGALYRNTLIYFSPQPVIDVSIKWREELEEAKRTIRDKYKRRYGKRIPADQQPHLDRELSELGSYMRPAQYTKEMMAQWLANDGAALKDHLKTGVCGALALLSQDLVDSSTPDYQYKAEATILRNENGRVIARINWNLQAGFLLSRPAELVIPMANETVHGRSSEEIKKQEEARKSNGSSTD